jgi:hypothetical protein
LPTPRPRHLPPPASGAYNLRVEGRSRETAGRAKASPEMRDLIRRRRKVVRTPLILGLIAVALLAVSAAVYFILQVGRKPVQTVDVRRVATLMLRALDRYYGDNGEYPPFLVGGASTVHIPGRVVTVNRYDSTDDFEEADAPGSLPNPDPLIAGGFLDGYPLVVSLPSLLAAAYPPLLYDPRGYARWRCMVSTAGDPLELMWQQAIEVMPQASRKGIKYGPSWSWFDRSKSEEEKENELKSFLASRHRLLALGGRALEHEGETRYIYDAGIVGAGGDALPYFGYQRGEWLGGTEHEAWLWFYGNNVWYDKYNRELREGEGVGPIARKTFLFVEEPVQGMDLLNAETGELEPDGISDGICILFELKDGEIVRVRYDSELITPLAEWMQYAD